MNNRLEADTSCVIMQALFTDLDNASVAFF